MLCQCPDINEVCVKARPNKSDYDTIHAFIYTTNVESVNEFIRTKVPEIYELKAHFHSERLPKLASGKFDGMGMLRSVQTLDFE